MGITFLSLTVRTKHLQVFSILKAVGGSESISTGRRVFYMLTVTFSLPPLASAQNDPLGSLIPWDLLSPMINILDCNRREQAKKKNPLMISRRKFFCLQKTLCWIHS